MQIVPDTSAIIDRRIADGYLRDAEVEAVLIPEVVVGELEAQANADRESGWDGLAEIESIRAADVTVRFIGERQSSEAIAAADAGSIDAIVRELASDHDATLITSDAVQAAVARAMGAAVEYIEPIVHAHDRLELEEYFDESTMSVHLKAGVRPKAKRGAIGEMQYEFIGEQSLGEHTVSSLAQDVRLTARANPAGFIEMSEPGMEVIQFEDYRIAIARPPFADAVEITAVRPIVKTDLTDYEFADELRGRLEERQRGVLIAGAPGAGKSTFAQAVAEFLNDADYAVKTMEKPRDLQVTDEVTQYTALGGSMAKTADSLLLVRPDYTIYDEVRKTSDFEVFADMRLAGVGMVGVVHATRAIDALQRLVGRLELGMIPQVVDTVIYIEAGAVETVYDVDTTVKVPAGLVAEDLARPVIQISDFETDTPAYEIYSFNRQVVTVPIEEAGGGTEGGVNRLARLEIEREIQSVARGDVEVVLKGQNAATVYVDDDDIPYVIGKGGGRITPIEDRLGISIDVRTHEERPDGGTTAPVVAGEAVDPQITGRHIVIERPDQVGETVEVLADAEYLFTATVGRGGEIQISRGSAIADELEHAIDAGAPITVVTT
ncbi:MAG: PINc/VapC family ATPase [Haloquadratum sp.]|nr:PINc/VapC family ATPase [Haloquadratum sp.]